MIENDNDRSNDFRQPGHSSSSRPQLLDKTTKKCNKFELKSTKSEIRPHEGIEALPRDELSVDYVAEFETENMKNNRVVINYLLRFAIMIFWRIMSTEKFADLKSTFYVLTRR